MVEMPDLFSVPSCVLKRGFLYGFSNWNGISHCWAYGADTYKTYSTLVRPWAQLRQFVLPLLPCEQVSVYVEQKLTRSMSAIWGYFSGLIHIVSFLPSAAFFNDTSFIRSFIGCLSTDNENMISFRTLDLNPTSARVSNESNARATLLNATRRIASSWGVHLS